VKAFVSALLLCVIFVLLQSGDAEAYRYHKHHSIRRGHATHHVRVHPHKLLKKKSVRVVMAVMPNGGSAAGCLFFCQGQLSSDVASYGAPSPWRAMQYKNAVTYRPALDVGPRPRAWCGWWLQTYTGVTSVATHLNLNRAIEWAQVGRASSPQIGAIVVWRHHVGKITGVTANGRYLVMSGNSGGRRGARTVTERPRSLRGAVAFRSLW
jgi:hypothetical protein